MKPRSVRLYIVGASLVLGAVLIVVLVALRGPGPTDGAATGPGGENGGDLFVLAAAVMVRGPALSEDPERFRPHSGAVLGNGAAFVDEVGGSLLVVAGDGSLEESELERPVGEGLNAPQFTGAAVTGTGSLLVSDLANGRVWDYAPDGRFVGVFAGGGAGDFVGLMRPAAVAVDTKGRVYVADVGDQTVKKFNKAGELIDVLGGAGFQPGLLDYPTGVVVDDRDLVYVADSNNRRVQVFDPEGRLVRVIGDREGIPGFQLPRSVALDSEGRLHVVDTFAQRVWVFDRTGSFLGQYGAGGAPGERLTLPEGVVALGDLLVVGDRGSGRFMVYGAQVDEAR